MTDDTNRQTDDRDPLSDHPATVGGLEALRAKGLLSQEAFERGVELVWPAGRAWRRFDRVMQMLGAVLVLAGVAYFFAYNWEAIPKLAKFGMIQAAIVVCVVVAGWKGLDGLPGNIALTAGAFLVGVFLAVFGQIYQTGADAWQLFAGWAALITGFLVVARNQAIWVLWAVLVTFGAAAWLIQSVPWATELHVSLMSVGLGALHLGLVALGEWARARRRPEWLQPPWSRWVLVASGLTATTGPASVFAMEFESSWEAGALAVAMPAWVISVAAVYWYFRHRVGDLKALTMAGLAAAAVPAFGLSRLAAELDVGGEVALLAFSLLVLGMTGALVAWLRHMAGVLDEEGGHRE